MVKRSAASLLGGIGLLGMSCTMPWFGSDPLAPKVFNASRDARAGDVIFVQGAHFDPSTRVLLGGDTDAKELQIVNRVTDTLLAAQIPATMSGPPLIHVANGHGTAPALRLNGALPQHLDATQITPGGRFRIFGRNLIAEGLQPHVRVNGVEAMVDVAASDPNMMLVTAPAGLTAGASVQISCDNRNGSGEASLDRAVPVGAGSTDGLSLGLGWGAGFDFTDRVIEAGPACDGTSDDAPVIVEAVKRAVQAGGAVVRLPAGNCRLAGSISLPSRVVLRGAGRDATILRYEANYPVAAENADLVGLQDLQLVNAGSAQEGVLWRNNTRSVIQRTSLRMGKSRQWFLTRNRDFLFDANFVEQTASYDLQNPYRFDESAGLVFSNNTSINKDGSPTFRLIHDSAILNNRFTRDNASQDESPVIAHHGLVLDFASRIAVIGNVFDVANGPVTNTQRNDGETILVEGGGPSRTERAGVISSATTTTVTSPEIDVNPDPFGTGLPENMGVVIVSGEGAGQVRRVVGVSSSELTVDRSWDVVPEPGSHLATFIWALQSAIIKGNTLKDNPRGIWLYQSAVDDVLIADNTISDGGGIFLRSFQDASNDLFTPQLNTSVVDNTIVNTSGRWMAYIRLAAVRKDPAAFGVGQLGIEVRRNKLVAHVPNITSMVEDYASAEGYASLVHVENDRAEFGDQPSVLGTIFQDNTCDHCERPFTIGSGGVGTVLAGNKPGPENRNWLFDLPSPGARAGGATGTVIR